jgi:hypothetical protein
VLWKCAILQTWVECTQPLVYENLFQARCCVSGDNEKNAECELNVGKEILDFNLLDQMVIRKPNKLMC